MKFKDYGEYGGFYIKCNLRKIRLDQKLTPTKLSILSGVSRWEISALERGECSPNIYTAVALARALNVSTHYLFEICEVINKK